MKSKKAFYNIVTEFTYQIIVIICSFILPKLILKSYGSEYNGVVSSITQFLNYISILTLGISGSTRMGIYRAKGDMHKISRVIKATQNYMKKISFIYILYVIILMVVFPFVINTDIEFLEISILVFIIGIGTFFEYSLGVSYSALISALQCKYIYNIILIIIKIVSTIASVLLIINGGSIFIVKLAGSIFFALGPIMLKRIVNKKFNLTSDVTPDNESLSYKKDVMAHSIANSVHEYTDIFLLSLFTNPKTISIYAVYNLFLNGVRKIQTMFTNGLEGAFGETWASGQKEKYKNDFNTFEFLIFSLISVLFSCTFLLLLPLIKIYTRGVTDTNYILPTFAYISVVTNMVFCLRTPYIVAVQSAGKYKETKKGAILEAIINFTLSIALVFPFGLVGVTIGTLVANLFRTIQYEIFASKHLIDRSNFVFIKRICWLISCFLIIVFMSKILPSLDINSWLKWIISGFYYFAIAFTVTIIMAYLFYRKELDKSFKIVKNMFNRKKRSKGNNE